jgi:plasmid stability protein
VFGGKIPAEMATIQVKNVPETVHAELRRRSAVAGQSLQEYLLARLVEQASRPSLDEVLSRAGSRAGGSVPFASAVEALRSARQAS